MILLRLLIPVLFLYILYRLLSYLLAEASDTIPCQRCEGKGFWYGVRERQECKRCNGSGKVLKQL